MQVTLQAHRVETTVGQDGTLTLDRLPFPAGESVEVILPWPASLKPVNPYSLRGSRVRYDDALQPVAPDDWDALR